MTFAEVADSLSRAVGRPVRYVDVTDEQLEAGMIGSGQPEWLATATLELNAYARQGHASMVTDTVERITGHAPATIDQWAAAHAKAFRE